MKIQNTLTENSLLLELGKRVKARRLDIQLSQAELAEQAGLSKRTIERIETGNSTQTVNLLRIFRILKLLDNFYSAIPEATLKPMDLITRRVKEKKRVSRRQKSVSPGKAWEWGDK